MINDARRPLSGSAAQRFGNTPAVRLAAYKDWLTESCSSAAMWRRSSSAAAARSAVSRREFSRAFDNVPAMVWASTVLLSVKVCAGDFALITAGRWDHHPTATAP